MGACAFRMDGIPKTPAAAVAPSPASTVLRFITSPPCAPPLYRVVGSADDAAATSKRMQNSAAMEAEYVDRALSHCGAQPHHDSDAIAGHNLAKGPDSAAHTPAPRHPAGPEIGLKSLAVSARFSYARGS